MTKGHQSISQRNVDDLVDLMEMMVRGLVDIEDAVQVRPTVSASNTSMILEVTVAPRDMPFVMGKEGRNVEAIKTIMHAMCTKLGVDCHINVVEHKT